MQMAIAALVGTLLGALIALAPIVIAIREDRHRYPMSR